MAFRRFPFYQQSIHAIAEPLESRRLLSGYILQNLASFGAGPNGNLIADNSGNLYGTTQRGGEHGYGMVFEYVKATATFMPLASFTGANGTDPNGGLVLDSTGNLFGTTVYTAAGITNRSPTTGFSPFNGSGNGTVFELAHGGTNIITLATFTGTNGQAPEGAMVMDAAGNLFGTTFKGGANGDGTVFEVAQGSGAITTLASFNGANGNNPVAGLTIDTTGNLFGSTTQGGASNKGVLFEVALNSNAIAVLTSFSQTDGAAPLSAMLIDASGNLFGTTSAGGPASDGTVFELPTGAASVTTLAAFDGFDGAFPEGTLLMDASGNLFGTAHIGGAVHDGVAFEIASGSGTITNLVSFNGNVGALPDGLATDGSGNFYGITQSGGQNATSGLNGTGTIFRLIPGGTPANPGVLSAKVQTTNLPTSVINGLLLVGGTAQVAISDGASESGPMNVNVYASANGVIDGSSILVGTTVQDTVIKAGEPFAITVNIPTVPLTAGNGFYTLLAQAVDPSGNTADATMGPGLQTVAPVIALSETITRLTLPTNVVSGAPTSAAAVLTITNSGNIPSNGRIIVSLYASPDGTVANGTRIVNAIRVPFIAPGGSAKVAIPLNAIPAGLNGTYAIVAQVKDQGGAFTTVATDPIYTISAPFVALAASIGSFTPSALSLASSTRGSFSITLTNNGNIPANSFKLNLGLINQDQTQTAAVQSYKFPLRLNPGASKTLTFSFVARGLSSLTPGIYFPTVAVSVLGSAFSTTATGSMQVTLN